VVLPVLVLLVVLALLVLLRLLGQLISYDALTPHLPIKPARHCRARLLHALLPAWQTDHSSCHASAAVVPSSHIRLTSLLPQFSCAPAAPELLLTQRASLASDIYR